MARLLTNLLPTMDSGNWSGTFSTDHAYTGAQSLKLTGTTSSAEITVPTTTTIALHSTHTYYARVYGYQETETSASVGFYWPIAEPNFKEGIAIKDAGSWQLYSGVNTRTDFSDGSYQFRLDFNNSYIAGVMYFDGAMLIDLTVSFGAGNEPTQDWCDTNIPYFEGTQAFFSEEDYVKYGSLPLGYTGLEYIESSGDAYIDTGYKHNQDTRVTMVAWPGTQTKNAWLFEGRNSTSVARRGVFFYYASTKLWTSDYPSSRLTFSDIAETDPLHIDYDGATCSINGHSVTRDSSTFQSSYNLYLMACNTAGTIAGQVVGKLYSCSIYDGGTLIRDFIPALREVDSVPGLYDVANSVFYASVSGTAFSAGPTIQTYNGLDLITDRTAADVSRAQTLDSKWVGGVWTGTAEELTEWGGVLKGFYNNEDMNRVEYAVSFLLRTYQEIKDGLDTLRTSLNVAGEPYFTLPFEIPVLTIKDDWLKNEKPSESDLERYLSNVDVVSSLIPIEKSLPESMVHLTYDGANEIEKALLLEYNAAMALEEQKRNMIEATAKNYVYSGEVYAGEI